MKNPINYPLLGGKVTEQVHKAYVHSKLTVSLEVFRAYRKLKNLSRKYNKLQKQAYTLR